jgi:hypothetical protein
MNARVFDIVVVKWEGNVDWFRADTSTYTLYEALTDFIAHGETMKILGYYPNTTTEQRVEIMRAMRGTEGKN